MFYFKTKLKESNAHGIGLFADEDIKKGELIWKPSPALVLEYSKEEFSSLPDADRKVIAHYGYFHKEFGKWHLDSDDSHFVNHSWNPTSVVSEDGYGIRALVDITKGDEITQNYGDFESDEDLRARGIY